MVGRGLRSYCAIHQHPFVLGLILALYTTLPSHVQVSAENCEKHFSKYQHCKNHTDGVHSLDCFGKYHNPSTKSWYCVWRPGNHISAKTYTLSIQTQGKKNCKAYNNITDLSKLITLYENYNMTARVFENSESEKCSKAVFKGSPASMLRCGPPGNVSFSRQSGKMNVKVSWQKDDIKAVTYYSVRYKARGGQSWSQPPVQSQNGERCTVENLNSSLVYTVQIQCITNKICSQCPWSQTYTVPSELTTPPVIANLTDTVVAEKKGCRLLSLKWKFSAGELHDGYYVSIRKASGEAPSKRMNTSRPEIRLVLSYSAYHLNISAINNASTSPAVSLTVPQPEDIPGIADGKLNVTVHSNTSLTVHWKDDLIKKYVCYSVEWKKKGHKAAYISFHQNESNNRTLSPLSEPLEPYERYRITLHTRPQKDTCNMKYINNSESTYGTTQFYFMEGTPVSAPNISSYNVTLNSVMLQWTSIPEEDIRGFLLGYIIHYTEYHSKGTSTERNITVAPETYNYKLEDLKGGTAYHVEISGFTKAGAGVRSTVITFLTNHQGYFDPRDVIIIFAVVVTVLIFGAPIIKRAKVILWPSIPNPGNSNAMQKIEGPCEKELLQSISTLKVEEWDTNSLQIVEKEAVVLPSMLPSVLPLLHDSEDEGDSAEMDSDWFQRDTEDATEDILPVDSTDTFSNVQQTNFQSSPFAFSSGYTTMEMFQQVMPQGVPANTAVSQATESDPEDTHVTKSRLDYVRQFSTSPILGSEEMSMIL